MKKAAVLVVLAIMLIGSCAAQSVTNDSQRLVGTWVSTDPQITLVLNANGTGTINGGNIYWGLSVNGELYVTGNGGATVYMSPDGKRMIWEHMVFQKR